MSMPGSFSYTWNSTVNSLFSNSLLLCLWWKLYCFSAVLKRKPAKEVTAVFAQKCSKALCGDNGNMNVSYWLIEDYHENILTSHALWVRKVWLSLFVNNNFYNFFSFIISQWPISQILNMQLFIMTHYCN